MNSTHCQLEARTSSGVDSGTGLSPRASSSCNIASACRLRAMRPRLLVEVARPAVLTQPIQKLRGERLTVSVGDVHVDLLWSQHPRNDRRNVGRAEGVAKRRLGERREIRLAQLLESIDSIQGLSEAVTSEQPARYRVCRPGRIGVLRPVADQRP